MGWLIGVLVLLGMGLAYLASVGSRRSYQCPNCGESVRVEHMKAVRCGHCGGPLDQTEGLS